MKKGSKMSPEARELRRQRAQEQWERQHAAGWKRPKAGKESRRKMSESARQRWAQRKANGTACLTEEHRAKIAEGGRRAWARRRAADGDVS
jgi:hypothetical protein